MPPETTTPETQMTPAGDPQVPQNQETLDTSKAERPENVPEKFWNPETGELNTEALLQSYTELEKGKTPTDEDTKEEDGNDDATEEPEETTESEESEETTSPFDSYYSEYAEKGELSPESYEKLEALGLTKEHVDHYIAGHESKQASADSAVYEVAGGEDKWDALQEWATTGGLTEAEVAYFDSVVDSGNVDAIKFAVTGLRAKYESATGVEANRVDAKSTNAGDIYADDDEINSDMMNPLYKTDATFRKQVTQKIQRTMNYR